MTKKVPRSSEVRVPPDERRRRVIREINAALAEVRVKVLATPQGLAAAVSCSPGMLDPDGPWHVTRFEAALRVFADSLASACRDVERMLQEEEARP